VGAPGVLGGVRRRPHGPTEPRDRAHPDAAWHLLLAGALIAPASYAVRVVAPLGEEAVQDLYVGQAAAWATGFALGAIGAERSSFGVGGLLLRVPGVARIV
jgi:hypothetical protein